MTRIYERRHAHLQGAIVAAVTEESPQCFTLALKVFNSDGNETP